MSPSVLGSSRHLVCSLVRVCVTPKFLGYKPIVNRPDFTIHQVFVIECPGYSLWPLIYAQHRPQLHGHSHLGL